MSYRICFVCMGNICRSPMAEVVMRSMVRDAGLEDQIELSSAGTGGWHVGDHADERARATLARRGYDAESHRARQFAAHWFDENDLVLAVDESTYSMLQSLDSEQAAEKLRLLREFDPMADGDLDVPDPYYGGQRGFDNVLDMVERSCRGLLEHVRTQVLA
ncbi:MAG TPA: low molecular weight protein-tyrosine-phosphatase [Acidothermaceae bacterium]|nr:low molecular weight protein-tyrosine-phosphatase [Acidothermaceae bacterium]